MNALTIELLNPKAQGILEGLENAGLIAITPLKTVRGESRLMELKGLGAEIWKDETVEEYLRKERGSWER